MEVAMTDAYAEKILDFLTKKNRFISWRMQVCSSGHSYLMLANVDYIESTVLCASNKCFPKKIDFYSCISTKDIVEHMFKLSKTGFNIFAISSIWNRYSLIPPFKNLEEVLVEMDLEQELL